MLFNCGMSNSFSEYTRFFFLLIPFFDDSDFVFCTPPGFASDIDFCLRLEIPSGSLPLDLGFDEDFDEDFPDEDLPLGLLPFVDERMGAILGVVAGVE